MNLASYIARYPNVRLAVQADNERLLDFYSKIQMQGGLFEVRFEKNPDYFHFLSYESTQRHVGVCENDAGEIEGMFSFSVRPCYLSGKRHHMVYASDLRFLPRRERKGRFDWKRFAFDLCGDLPTIDEFAGSQHMIVAIIAANRRARDAMSSAKAPFENRTIDSYRMVSLLARKPLRWRRRQEAGIHVTQGREGDRDALSAFLDAQNRRRMFGYVFEGQGDDNELIRRLHSWEGFSMESFLIARDQAGVIVGCFAPWDPSLGRRIVLTKVRPVFAALLGVAKRLVPRLPSPGSALKILYLTTFEVDSSSPQATREAVVHAILKALHKRGDAKQSHVTAICDYDGDSFLPQLRAHYYLMQTPTLLGQLCRSDAPQLPSASASRGRVGHELCLT